MEYINSEPMIKCYMKNINMSGLYTVTGFTDAAAGSDQI